MLFYRLHITFTIQQETLCHIQQQNNRTEQSIKLMTFFATQKRNLSLGSQSELGPGKYNTPASPESKSLKGYAPFGSCTSKKQRANKNVNLLGPGAYNISSPFGKPSISKYQSDKCVIIKINDEGSCQFKSTTERFNNNLKEVTPGPGQYENLSKRARPHSVKTLKSITMQYKIRQLNNYLKQERRRPTIQSDPIMPDQPREQKDIRRAMTSKGVVRWSLNKKERFAPLVYQNFSENDRTEILGKVKQEKKPRAKKPMGVFQSRSVKSHIQSSMYHTNNPYKMEIRKLLNFKDPMPAPGTYDIRGCFDKPFRNKYQFFGSSVDRFQEKHDTTKDIGPGYYHRQFSTSKKSRKIFSLHLSSSKQQRCSYIKLDDSVPGPGSYEAAKTKIGQKKLSDAFKTNSFGSQQPRFHQSKIFVEQKPSNQLCSQQDQIIRVLKKQEEYQYRKKIRQGNGTCAFKSTKQRDCFEQNREKAKIPFAQYEVSNYDISRKTKKYNQLVQQLENCHLQRPPFNSSVQRFKTDFQQESQHKNCWCQVKSIEKKPFVIQSSSFKSKTTKGSVFQNKSKGPAVGQYEDSRSIVKGSFNAKYMKKAHDKKKKMKLWKQQTNRSRIQCCM